MSVGTPPRPLPPEPTAVLDELIAVAHRFGADTEFSRGGGGNASAKVDGVLYIKPSGVPLATLEAGDLVPLDIAPLLELLHGDERADAAEPGSDPVMRTAMEARLAEAGGRRPSVELLFHAFLPERFVVHTHPILLNELTCSREAAEAAARLFGDEAVWVPYTDPGLPLAREIVEQRRRHGERTGKPAPSVILLQNHGIIVAADTAREIEELTGRLVEAVKAVVEPDDMSPATNATRPERAAVVPVPRLDPGRASALVDGIGPALRGLLGDESSLPIVTFDGSERAAAFPATEAGRGFVLGGPLTPDQIVYAGSWPLLVDVPEATGADDVLDVLWPSLAAHVQARGVEPIVVVMPGLGIFVAGESWAQADTARHIYLDALRVGEGALGLGGARPLSDAERTFIESWEAESYRKEIAAGPGSGGRFDGRVALVTGAAQGFGLAIATDLVAQGGHVVLADLKVDLAEANARDLEARFGPGRATAVAMNVADDASVAAGIHAAVERYGGVDLYVSNAGVLLAGGVTSQAISDFDLVTTVNYRGYFLGVRHVAPIMARQHRARPERLFDIVEINSKSGLSGSSRNSAYAGSKFGGIGLTQSFALELMGDGIKVNAICPGNYFEGPLWSDPDRGLFVQYLREGKVPGAETIEDVRRAYESKVPMGRGCTPRDVLEALYYLVAQQYETGQALPVTGGQVMLS